MSIIAFSIGNNKATLWGLSSNERLQRQIAALDTIHWGGIIEQTGQFPDNPTTRGQLLLLINSNYLFEPRTLAGFCKHPQALLLCPADGKIAAALVHPELAESVISRMLGADQGMPEGLKVIETKDLRSYDRKLRRATPPLLEPITEANKDVLESLLYGNAYKGVTDFVTKWIWPKPAKLAVKFCAKLGVTPNRITSISLILVIAASYWFAQGNYGLGLIAAWLMTFLDTVDGKLARVTVNSSRFGHYFDHLIDLIHPPFWYVFWGLSLPTFEPVLGLDKPILNGLIVTGYLLGRITEGIFKKICGCSIFTWQPFDSYFRLITARRNPCLVILSISWLLGQPQWGFIGVALWTVITSAILLLRLFQGLLYRYRKGPLTEWLADPESAKSQSRTAFEIFSATRSAYSNDSISNRAPIDK